MALWQLITGEYPPQAGGVGDYSRLVANALVAAGDEVHVWGPGRIRAQINDGTTTVHRLSDHFGAHGLATLSSELQTDGRLLVQYVPHAFGAKAMNVAFAAWLLSRRHKMPIDVMFHEVAFPVRRGQSLRHNFLGIVTRMMALMVARSAERIFVAIPEWERTLRSLVRAPLSMTWLPVPSNIPIANEGENFESLRSQHRTTHNGVLIGHFGTYGEWISKALQACLVPVLERHSDAALLLIGNNSESFRTRLLNEHSSLASRIHATGELRSSEVSRHISICDLMVQPYPDGISGRRASAMAVLSHGRAMVTTSGDLTEPLWNQKAVVALAKADDSVGLSHLVEQLIRDNKFRQHLADAGRCLYSELFDITHTIAALRSV